MKEFKEKVGQLRSSWKAIHKAMSLAPEAWKPYLRFTSPDEVKEVISSIELLLDRSKALPGFKPTYRVAKGFAITALENALSSAKNLENSQWANFPTFLTSLNQVLAAFHTMFLYSDKDETRDLVQELGGKLIESLSLLDTAQKELANKKNILDTTQKDLDKAIGQAEEIEICEKEAKEQLETITTTKNEAQKILDTVKANNDALQKLTESLEEELNKNKLLQENLENQRSELRRLQVDCREQKDLITNLLPDAASAGLAASFASRVKQLEKSKWFWMWGFIVSIIGLIVVGYFIYTRLQLPYSDYWQIVLQKIPFTAPFIWLGWFSAIQYGNTIRVQEDYSFKEATSKAFVGYKDHMEHLSDINIEDTKSAMKILATKTIDILSREPLRIYQKAEHDATPFKSIFNKTNKVNQSEKAES